MLSYVKSGWNENESACDIGPLFFMRSQYFFFFYLICPIIISFWETFRELETFGNLNRLLFKALIVLYE
jgi:hypothetical protein